MNHEMLSGRRVLVIEDEMLVLMALEDMFSDLGCTSISSAATVDRALTLIDGGDFDLATLDVNLGGDRSDAVADALHDHHIPFVYSTGYGEHGVTEGHTEPVLRKPFTAHQFITVVRSLLGASLIPPTVSLARGV